MDIARARLVAAALLCGLALCRCGIAQSQPDPIELGNVDRGWSAGHDPLQSGGTKAAQREAGASVQLRCRGSTGQFVWTYPGKNESDKAALRGSREIEVTRGRTDGEFLSTLTLLDMTYLDTGEYECACANRTPEHATSHTRSRAVVRLSVYLFVRDASNLLQGRRQSHETQVVVGKTGRAAVLPCASTAPDSRVQLYRESGTAGGERSLLLEWPSGGGDSALERESGDGGGRSSESSALSVAAQYDPRVGFILEALTLRLAGHYVCRAELGNSSQERRVFLHVISGLPSSIMKPWIHSKAGYSFAEGASVTLRCLALVIKGNPVSIQWSKLPDNKTIENSSDQRISVKPAQIERVCPHSLADCAFKRRVQEFDPVMAAYNRAHSQLRIRSATISDSGTYVCTASTVGIAQATMQEVEIYKDDANS